MEDCCCCLWCGVALLAFFVLWKLISTLIRSLKVKGLDKRSVLITGCDTGFGRAAAVRLHQRGMTVFAACLGQKAVDELQQECPTDKMKAFVMNVTDDKSVSEGYAYVHKHVNQQGLWAIINNAGVLRGGPLEICELSDWKLCLDVNVMGIARVTKQFFPLIRANPEKEREAGRIINVASVAGRLALPGTACYSASKFAVQGLSDALRRECRLWNVKVVIIEPGMMKTPLYDAPLDAQYVQNHFKSLPEEIQQLYGINFLMKSQEDFRQILLKFGGDPIQVVDGMEKAETRRYPHTRMPIGSDTGVWLWVAALPTCVSDFLMSLAFGKVLPENCPANKK
jgi:NADP-dependent 3-hydroxy acid dehydrogenase YdfG